MRLSTKSRFAVTAMIDLALRQHLGPVCLSAISQRQQISISYLEQIFSKMRQFDLVESTRGPGGGYTLARDATQISIAEIIQAVSGPSQAERQMLKKAQDSLISTQELWSTIDDKMQEHLQSISLHSMVATEHEKGARVPVKQVTKSGVFAQKQKGVVSPQTPNSVFALATALAHPY